MTRFLLTLKQHRFEIIGATLVCLGLAALALYQTWQLNSVVFPKDCNLNGNVLMGYNGPDACTDAVSRFNGIRNGTLMSLLQVGLIFAPFLVAVLLGAPVVAREIEQNTAPLSWALAGSRRRWLLGRVASILIVFVPLMLALGVSADVLYGAMNPGTSPWASLENYGLRGIPVVFWGLAAFLGTVSLGTLFGRTMPAVFVALVICLFARVGGEYYFQRLVLAPYAQPLISAELMGNGYPWTPSDLTIYYKEYLDGKPFDGDVGQWYSTHTPPPEMFAPPASGPTADPNATPDPSSSPNPNPTLPPDMTGPIIWGPTSLPYGFHGDHYWPVVAAESGILAGGSLFLASIAFFWVGRRRPY